MKLKKIASLALAGIMAVSMLAGCKDGDNGNGGSSSSGTTVTAAPIVSAMNSELSEKQKEQLSFASNAKLAAAVAKGAEKVTYEDIKKAGVPTLLSYVNKDNDIIDAIEDQFDGVLPKVVMKADNIAAGTQGAGNGLENYDQTFIWTYLVDGSVESTDKVAEYVMNGVNGMKDMFYEGGNITGNGAFSHTYKGYVEMTKVTNDNTGDSCYLVAVMVEKSSTSTGASST